MNLESGSSLAASKMKKKSPFPLTEAEYVRHRQWMERALLLAQAAGEAGEIPVGAVITDAAGNWVTEATNRKQRDRDPSAHAEILALRSAGYALGNWHLNNCILYVTLEPCPMCAGAMIQARLGLLVYGADDPKTGSVRTVLNLPDSAASNHRLQVIGGILETRCRQQLQAWFERKRQSQA